MRQRSTKTAKYKISYRECLAVFNNEQMSTLQGNLYMIPDQTKTNANIKKNAYQHQTKKLKGPIPDKKHSTKRNACGKTNFRFIFQNHFTVIKWIP
jgi:hypothetical protein